MDNLPKIRPEWVPEAYKAEVDNKTTTISGNYPNEAKRNVAKIPKKGTIKKYGKIKRK